MKGYRLPFAEKLYARGTPPMWGLSAKSKVESEVRQVRIGDKLAVSRQGDQWLVFRGDVLLGACRWRAADNGREDPQRRFKIVYPEQGELEVTQVLELAGRVVDFGGVVSPSRAES